MLSLAHERVIYGTKVRCSNALAHETGIYGTEVRHYNAKSSS